MGCDWSESRLGLDLCCADATGPTGEGFVSGSYDRTIRLWDRDAGKARDIYHTKRMQRSVCLHLPFRMLADTQRFRRHIHPDRRLCPLRIR